MAERLGEMALAGAAGPDDEHRDAVGEIAPGGELVDEGAVQLRQALEVELLEGLGGAEGGASQSQGELLLLAPGDLVLDEEREELGVGELGIEGLAVTGFERIEDAGEAQLLEVGGEFGDGIHGSDLLQGQWCSGLNNWPASRAKRAPVA